MDVSRFYHRQPIEQEVCEEEISDEPSAEPVCPCDDTSCADEVCDLNYESPNGDKPCGHRGCLPSSCKLYNPEVGVFNFFAPPACINEPPPPPPGRFFPVPTQPVFAPRGPTEFAAPTDSQ